MGQSMDIQHLKQLVAEQVRHPYLAKFIPEPVIDEDKLVILSSIVAHTSFSQSRKEQYIVTTMLVQIALDTHDLVTLSDDDDNSAMVKKRQLTVLAGDYYSGLYYYLLSTLEDIPMIHTLASAIKEINELKMEIYYQDVRSFQEFMSSLKKVESLLIQRVASYVERTSINDVAGEWLLTNKLVREKESYQEGRFSPVMDILMSSKQSIMGESQLLPYVDQTIQMNIHRLEKAVSQLPIHLNWLKSYVDTTINLKYYDNHVAEEG
ncbi:heptaprenyl diphosphate synthase component 1 [Thalassobacillus sp. CUG 92003]|uniref:heptaprenyl diphosphate synthase component 1 n=1 Tax=Thalassobacillus sp. CUG 92003 TaxID=2736641 RepID=UPI0015E750DC|nr:heptaprenyl diphosphate synthase component 1 [Thalassobacillus sp. CUG 92003]